MRISIILVIESIKLLARQPLHPVNAECPFCHQTVRLYYNRAGRRHLLAHARALYEGSRYSAHYARTPNVLVQALWLNLILIRLKIKLFKWPKSLDYDSP